MLLGSLYDLRKNRLSQQGQEARLTRQVGRFSIQSESRSDGFNRQGCTCVSSSAISSICDAEDCRREQIPTSERHSPFGEDLSALRRPSEYAPTSWSASQPGNVRPLGGSAILNPTEYRE